MKKLILLWKIYWSKILIIAAILLTLIASGIFANYCFKNYNSVEAFSRKQLAAQVALMLPMFVITYLVSIPIMIGLQFYFMQGGFCNRM